MKNNPFYEMHPDNYRLPISILTNFGLTNNAIGKLPLDVEGNLEQLAALSIDQISSALTAKNKAILVNLATVFERNTISVLKYFLDLAQEHPVYGPKFDVFIRRAKGETLQQIGDSYLVTDGKKKSRQYVQIMEEAFYDVISPFVKVIYNDLRGRRQRLTAEEVCDVYDNDDYDFIMMYAGKVLKDKDRYEYLDFADMFIKLDEEDSKSKYNDQATAIIEEFVGEGIDFAAHQEELENSLSDVGMDYVSIDHVYNYMRKNNYTMRGSYVFKRKPSYAFFAPIIIEKYFPNGIKTNQVNSKPVEDLAKFREIMHDEFGYTDLPAQDRALSARIENTCILCDRGRITSPNLIQIDRGLLRDIVDHIDKSVDSRIYFSDLFNDFKDRLNKESNINNYNFLHGVLTYYFPDQYFYDRDYLEKPNGEFVPAYQRTDKVCDYIKNKGCAVSKTELQKAFGGIRDSVILNRVMDHNRLIFWAYNMFNVMDNIHFDNREVRDIKKFLHKLLKEHDGYLSSVALFERFKLEFPDFVVKNDIVADSNLFYVLQYILGEDFEFRRPHIATKGRYSSLSFDSIFMEKLGSKDILRTADYNELIADQGWSDVTAYTAYVDLLDGNYCRLARDKYIKKDLFNIDEQVAQKVQAILLSSLKDDALSIQAFDAYDQLPELGYEWNEYLLETVITMYCPQLRLIKPNTRDRRYQKSIMVTAGHPCTEFDEYIASVMKAKDLNNLTEPAFLRFLISQKLCLKMIPKELYHGKYIRLEKDLFVVGEDKD